MAKVPMSNAAVSLRDKLNLIAGQGSGKERDRAVRRVLHWHTKAKSTVRHLLRGDQRPSLDEAAQIEAAFKARQAEDRALYLSMTVGLEAMEKADAEFYGPHIEAIRKMLLRGGNMGGSSGGGN